MNIKHLKIWPTLCRDLYRAGLTPTSEITESIIKIQELIIEIEANKMHSVAISIEKETNVLWSEKL